MITDIEFTNIPRPAAPPADEPAVAPEQIRADATWHGLTWEQYRALCQALSLARVHRNPAGFAYVKSHDVSRSLTRIFGFGMWSQEITRLVLEHQSHSETPAPTERNPDKMAVRATAVYTATVRLTVRCPDGFVLGPFEDVAAGDGVNQTTLGDAFDLASKTAVSQALKRAARHLGDQFGLSLYAGYTGSSLTGSMVHPPAPADVTIAEDGMPQTTPSIPTIEVDEKVTKFLAKVFEDTDEGPRVIATYEDLKGKLWKEASTKKIIDLPAVVTAAEGEILTVRQVLVREGAKLGNALKAVTPADLDVADEAGQGLLDCGCDAQAVTAEGAHQGGCAR